MKKTAFVLTLIASLALGGAASAADAKTYLATGKVISSSAALIRVYTAVQNIDIVRDASTKVNGDVKKGALVKITYTKVNGMAHATQVDVTTK